MVFGGSNQVDELSDFSLMTRLVEEFDDVDVIVLLSEMILDEMVNRSLEQERIIYRDKTDFGLLVPAWLSSASDRRVHDIVGNEEERLQLFDSQKGQEAD